MNWLSIIYSGVPFLASCISILSYIENKFPINKKNNVQEKSKHREGISLHNHKVSNSTIDVFEHILSYEKLDNYDAAGIVAFVSLICLIGTPIIFGIDFYINPPGPYCMDTIFPPYRNCTDPIFWWHLVKGFGLGIVFLILSVLFFQYIVWSSCYRKIEYKIRCLDLEKKQELLEIINNHHWRYPEVRKQFEKLIRDLIEK